MFGDSLSQFAAPPLGRRQGVEAEHLRGCGIFFCTNETTMQELTQKQQERLHGQIEQVRTYEHGALQWAKAIYNLKTEGLWESSGKSWGEFCEDTFGYSRRWANECVQAVAFIEGQKVIAETTGEDVIVPTSVSQALKVMKSERGVLTKIQPIKKNNNSLSNMPARLDPTTEITFTKPAPLPGDLRQLLESLERHFNKMIHRPDVTYELMQELRLCYHELRQAQALVQQTLPGFESTEVKVAKFKVPTQEQVLLYCAKAGIAERDGIWFWTKMEGSGWKNGGQKVKSWEKTILAWKIAGYLPSQKVVAANGQMVAREKTLMQKQVDELHRKVEAL